jgi:hypothetical protein
MESVASQQNAHTKTGKKSTIEQLQRGMERFHRKKEKKKAPPPPAQRTSAARFLLPDSPAGAPKRSTARRRRGKGKNWATKKQ